MLLKSIQKVPGVRPLFTGILNRWVDGKTTRFEASLNSNATVLDIGAGNCLLAQRLRDNGYNVTALDVKNLSVNAIEPIMYNGTNIPFNDQQFDQALLITVLHHTDSPERIVQEARRVARNLVIIEDTYNNRLHKYVTQFMDFIVNVGHSKMTYENKSEREWEQLFAEQQLHVVKKSRKRVLLFFQQTTYILETK